MAANGFHIQVVTDRLRPLERSLPVIEAALAGGADSVRLRDEAASMTAALQALRQSAGWDRDRIVVSGEPNVAGSFGMRWLHLPSAWLDQTPPFGKFGRIGLSVHSLEEAIEAEALGADYLAFGHLHATASHPGEPGRGLLALADIVDRAGIPVLAIGGITHANVAGVLATGCAGISVISAVADQPDPLYAMRKLVEAVEAVTSLPRIPLTPLPPTTRKGSSR